ncbi:NAD(P)-binding protein [Raineyella sp. LH-20]|uniref:NAD(P)-binding protein n=1 Tax=Raineyella sp. LH-20 TaxID=3081204 RepID=UPI002954D3A4|nr:NAD(P)-binding protein [Raineyella sp. LH-20]WOP17635.1 NAD(P)-binding protein [Raineyella sp. LH-20]
MIVGGGLAGMAAAARLAKRGHRVTLLHRTERLGADWRPDRPDGPGRLPEVLTLPAPWRDLFKKSGRILPAELARAGLDLVPAPPTRHVFAGGEELILGGDRGEQFHRMVAVYGEPVAEAWRDLVDSLEPVWHRVRTLGLETSLVSGRQLRPHRQTLMWGRTVADLAATQPHPHLRALVEASAWRQGHDPARTPAFVASRLNVERTFGRWTVVDTEGRPAGSERLLDLLEARLAARGVEVVRHDQQVRFDGSTRHPDGRMLLAGPVDGSDGVPVGELLPADVRPDAVVLTEGLHDPTATYGLRTRAARQVRTLTPVLRPRRTYTASPAGGPEGPATGPADAPITDGVAETVDHTARQVSWATADRTLVHDWGAATADPAAGPGWNGADSWLRRLPVRLGERLYSAGPWGRGGDDLAGVLMSAALATYDAHFDLTGQDTHPSNKDQ